MESLKNIPELPTPLQALIPIQPGQIISMALSKNEKVSITLFGIAQGESISEEEYAKDTMYYILEGKATLSFHTEKHTLNTGDCIAVPAGRIHAIDALGALKMLQIMF